MTIRLNAGTGGRSLPIVAGLGMSMAVGWSYANVGAVAPDLARDYAVSVGAIGFLTTVVLAVYTVMQLPTGRALDRLGPRGVGAAGLVVIALANAIALAGDSFWLALAGRTLLGVGTPLAYLGGLELIRRLGGSAQLLGSFGAVNGGSMGLALIVVPQLYPALAWRAPYLSSELLVAVALVALVRRPARGRAPAGPGELGQAATAWTPPSRPPARRVPTKVLLRDPELRRLSVMNLCSAAFSPIVSSWVVALLVEAGGYSTAKAGAVGSITLLGIVASRPIAGWIVHRHPAAVRAGIVVSAGLGVGGCVLLTAAGPVWLSVIGCAFVGVATGIPWTYVFTRAPNVIPAASGSALAVVSGLPLLVAIAGVPLVGLTFALPGDGRIGFAAVAALWCVLLFVLPARAVRPGAGPGVERGPEPAAVSS